MDKIKKNQVLEILDYWKTVEFLGQIDIREESQENRKAAGKARRRSEKMCFSVSAG